MQAESVELVADHNAAERARHHVIEVLKTHEVEDDVLGVAELLVSEVISHFVQHQNSPAVDVTVLVDHAVNVRVSGAIRPASIQPVEPTGARGATGIGERGHRILDALATAWGTHREAGRTAVWLTIDRSAESSALERSAEAALESGSVARLAAVTAERAAAGAAARTASAAQNAQVTLAAAAIVAAEAVAETAARTVETVQLQADELARAVATAAALAAATLSSSIVPGDDAAAARAAMRVSAAVMSAAAAKAEETARAAVLVAGAVAAAASSVAATTAAAAAAIEVEVSDAAVAVRAVTTATARRLADDTHERGAALALATREAEEASARWQEANQKLLQDGRNDRTIAMALQAAMLTKLPASPDLQMAARYLTAIKHDQVGGDWYDALVLPDRSTMLVIGDIVGHDIAAAAVMGQVRNLLRALAWDRNEPPSALVGRLDRVMRDLEIRTLATMIMVSIEHPAASQSSAATTLRWTNAGHPAPVLIHPDGTAIALDDTTDILLGVRPDTSRRDHFFDVPPGATLLLYTDGLIETRGDSIDAGLQRLLGVVSRHHRLEPDDLLGAVLGDMIDNEPDDDVAVLAVRFR